MCECELSVAFWYLFVVWNWKYLRWCKCTTFCACDYFSHTHAQKKHYFWCARASAFTFIIFTLLSPILTVKIISHLRQSSAILNLKTKNQQALQQQTSLKAYNAYDIIYWHECFQFAIYMLYKNKWNWEVNSQKKH